MSCQSVCRKVLGWAGARSGSPDRAGASRSWASRSAIPVLGLAALMVVLSGCASAPETTLAPQPDPGPYRLGVGDQVRILILEEPQFTDLYTVNDAGMISLPVIGSLAVSNLTTAELERADAQRLEQGFIEKAHVSAEIRTYRPVYIIGEVSRPGRYPYEPGMTVLTAVAVSGGFSERAVVDEFSVLRTAEGQSQEWRADRNTRLLPGDVITVYERFF